MVMEHINKWRLQFSDIDFPKFDSDCLFKHYARFSLIFVKAMKYFYKNICFKDYAIESFINWNLSTEDQSKYQKFKKWRRFIRM